ncbi:MAG: restriction endonuclease subunit S [Candidatus Binatia bacterium]
MLSASNELPINWKSVSISQVLETIESGKRPKGGVRNVSDGVPSVGGEHLTWDGGFDFSETRYVPVSFFESMQKRKVRVGDVLVVKDGATTGKTAFVNQTFPFSKAAVNEHVFVLRSRSDVCLGKFLFYTLFSPLGQRQIQQSSHGAAQGGINQQFVDEVMIPLPPLSEQLRIVAKIEALFDRIREAKRLRAEGAKDLGQLMAAELADVFPDPRGELPEGWEGKNVEEISERPQYGYTQAAKDEAVGPKFLRITDIQNGQVNWEAVPYCDCDAAALKKYKLQAGDLLFARSGATTGKTFLVAQCPEAVFASCLIRLRLRPQIMPEYVYWFFQSTYYWEQVRLRGAAQPNMNARILGDLRVPIPRSENEQRGIVARIEGIAETVGGMKQRQEDTDAELKRLEQAILDRAFRGEL